MIQELDCVRIGVDLPEHGIRRGDIGTVVHVFRDGAAYEIEFVGLDGQTIDVVSATPDQVRPVAFPEVRRAKLLSAIARFCDDFGPKFTADQLFSWLREHGASEPKAELSRYIRLLRYRDEESGESVRRLWSFRDSDSGGRYYLDIQALSPERRRHLIDYYHQFVEQLRGLKQQLEQVRASRREMDSFLARQAS